MNYTATFLVFVAVMVVLVGVPVLLLCFFKKCREHPIEAMALYAGTVLVAVILGVNVHDRWRSIGQGVVIDTPTGPESPLFTATGEELKHTWITPVLTDSIPDSTNVIYCASFQLAWDKLRNDYVHEPIRLEGNPPFVGGLNTGRFTRNDIADSACLVMAGRYKAGILQQIDAEMRRKFNAPMPSIDIPRQDARGNPPDLIVYAYLEKQLSYAHPFEHIEAGINFGDTLVAAFGQLKTNNIFEQQAKIYQDTDGIAVELIPEGDDRIYLAKMPRPATLQAGWERLQQLLAGSRAQALGQDETMCIPKMNFDFLRTYGEFAGRYFANRTMREYYISRALQNIRFRLDERGAELKSYSMMDLRACIGVRMDLLFDQPFLLCLKEKDAANPYFVMWVDNPEVLVRQ